MVLDKILRAGEGRILRKLKAIAEQVNLIEDDFTGLTDAELRGMTDEFRQRLTNEEESLDSLLPEAFAAVREAARRTLGQRHFDVQIMGGAALHLGNIAEMKTGEGKTLVSTLPAYLNALSGDGVHIVTVNDYLAQRDAENMGRVHRFLGLTVGVIHPQMPPAVRRQQYQCDITYGTNNEFGFDYLRDNMSWSAEELVQRGHHFAVVDEVDSILIDEARTPLIISGPADNPTRWYTEFARIAPLLEKEVDYEVEEGKRTVAITESGVEKVEDQLGIDNLYESVNTPLVGYLNNSLKAKELYKRDKDYIVTDGEVLIVDEFTGRVLHGRRYSEGMHQAIEAKEKVEIKQENQTLATITLQNYFRLYDKLSGMTGTAMTEAAEFSQIYKLGVVPIPTNKTMARADQPDVVYKTEIAKFDAVVEDIAERHEKGQPVLVGTTSVEKSEYLSKQLTKRGVRHEVLNAKHHEREALIIAEAGRRGAVTVATNMAGRGTDIMLGGNPEFTAQAELRQRGLSPIDTPEDYEAAWSAALEKARASVAAEHEEVVQAGGLYVLGTERHESRRIDNQLRGRAGRQGDAGESRFYLSLGDDLMRLFNAAAVEGIMDRLNIPDDVPIESKIVTRAIRSAQTQVEGQNFEIRKNVLKYDEVMNKQRTVIYEERRKVLEGADLHEQVRHFVDDTIEGYARGATADGYPEEWDLDTLWTGLGQLYPIGVDAPATDDREGLTSDLLLEDLQADAQEAYDRRELDLGDKPDGEAVMRELERRVVLAVLDRKWREHLYEMDYLQEGIGLRAMGQRDPVVEYQREGFDMFQTMMEGIKEESVRLLFNVEVQVAGRDTDTGTAGAAAAVEAPAAPEAPMVPAVPAVSQPSAPAPPSAPPGSARTAPSAAPAGAPATHAPPPVFVKGLEPRRPTGGLQYTAPSVDGAAGPVTTTVDNGTVRPGGGRGPASAGPGARGGEAGAGRTARNAPCPCGSGRKFKRCHGDPARRNDGDIGA
ncbi:preprotein translocase subunit SecA [Parafrankia colletiae]|uniref:Protein translocase subunit SecA n=1 Tax=Parafrankia colletiae TaxID=573497 RepID=A0A1S1Q6R5_9ACTN|nr:preprotein translocase subunit SecA [Parafrankia colletiae]MCK9903977.1 preprotein translocase subunit SecA [Frankia sp. Cpl3]OHV28885.1 preprotein translocase subunit SecA [Parafrankia colletiae]